MPDQSSAATEHAILQEITAPLATLPDDPVAVVVNADFPVAMRGYDRLAVDAYVQQTSQLVAELHATRSPEAAVRRALERLGEQISGVLQRAHETGEQITAQSRIEAEDRLVKSRIEAAEIAAAAQQRVSDLDADTDRIWAERRQIVEDARNLAQQLLALAETAAERFPAAEPGPYDDQATTTTTRAPIVTEDPQSRYEAEEQYVAEPEDEYAAEAEAAYEAGDEYVAEPELAAEREDEYAAEPGAPYAAEPREAEADSAAAGEIERHDEMSDEDEAHTDHGRRAPSEDLDATVAFRPIDIDDPANRREGEPPDEDPPPRPPRDPRRSSSVIPPASQAANRRSSR